MDKIVVLGSPGSGKSTFTRRLNTVLNYPIYYMDMLFWNNDGTHISSEELMNRVNEIIAEDKWIFDGNYLKTIKARCDKADTIFFLDYPLQVCLDGVKSRIGTKRDDMPWVEDSFSEEFYDYIVDFHQTQVPIVKGIINEYKDKNIIIFKSREEAIEYLTKLGAVID